jgi:hypothetical protein
MVNHKSLSFYFSLNHVPTKYLHLNHVSTKFTIDRPLSNLVLVIAIAMQIDIILSRGIILSGQKFDVLHSTWPT